MENVFVIRIVNDQCETFYFAIDRDSGGCPYWARFIGAANFFTSVKDAESCLDGSVFKTVNKMTDGTIYPPIMIHSGLGICNNRPTASGVIDITRVCFETCGTPRQVLGSITKGK